MEPLNLEPLNLMSPNEPAVLSIAQQIADCLPGWQFNVVEPLAGVPMGIVIEFDPKDTLGAQRARTLLPALIDSGLQVYGPYPALPTPPERLPTRLGGPVDASVRITIGRKP